MSENENESENDWKWKNLFINRESIKIYNKIINKKKLLIIFLTKSQTWIKTVSLDLYVKTLAGSQLLPLHALIYSTIFPVKLSTL